MMKKMMMFFGCALVLAGGAVSQAWSQEPIYYLGSSTVGKYMAAATGVYQKSLLSINTRPESGGGENAIAIGRGDVGGVARNVRPEILARGVEKFLIGRDAIGVWVHQTNSVANLSFEQLRGIFSGTVVNWKSVGGPDAPINVYVVNPLSATRKVFQRAVLGMMPYGGKRIRTVRPDPAILDRVAEDPNGIGQLSFSFADMAKKVKRIRVNGEESSVENVNYPITRPLHLITKGAPKKSVQDFIDWTLSDAGQSVVKRYFVGVR